MTSSDTDAPKFTSPPIQHVRPPPDVAQRPHRVLIYGYPITNELIELRYGIIKASHPNIRFLENEIRKLHPEGKSTIRVMLAETVGHEGGSIPLLAVGVPGREPPADQRKRLRSALPLGDTQASFSPSVKTRLRQGYSNRCAICLLDLPEGGVHLFDLSSRGANQVSIAQGYGVLAANFQRNSVRNGFLQCPLCHLVFFTPNHVALSPSVPVLRYIDEYLANTVVADRLPLHEVFRLLRLAGSATGSQVNLPQDPTPVLPYLDLFSLVILNPTDVAGLRIPTLYLPKVHSIQNGVFRPARTRSTTSALIFDVVAAGNDTTVSHGFIPLSPEQDEFNTQRYWRLPIDTENFLATLIDRTFALPPQSPQAQIKEILFARMTFWRLLVSSDPGGAGHGGGGGGGPGGGAGHGRGRGGHGGGYGNARAGPSKTRERGEPTKKKRRTNENLDLGFFMEEIAERASLSSCERPHYGVNPKEWVVTTPFLTLADGKLEPQAKAYSGYSPSNRESDCGEDNSREWRFGPLFTSTMIIATARQMRDM